MDGLSPEIFDSGEPAKTGLVVFGHDRRAPSCWRRSRLPPLRRPARKAASSRARPWRRRRSRRAARRQNGAQTVGRLASRTVRHDGVDDVQLRRVGSHASRVRWWSSPRHGLRARASLPHSAPAAHRDRRAAASRPPALLRPLMPPQLLAVEVLPSGDISKLRRWTPLQQGRRGCEVGRRVEAHGSASDAQRCSAVLSLKCSDII